MSTQTTAPAGNHAYYSIFRDMGIEEFKQCIQHHLVSFQGRDPDRASDQDVYRALSYALRDVLMEKWIKTQKTFYAEKMKRVYYLSLEFLVGRSLGNAIVNMGLMHEITQALQQLGYDLEALQECEEDAALGNGGLGRLASCFMDSIATMKIPAYGYGIRYDFGLFNQKIVDGYQVETPDSWLRLGSPWMYERTSFMYPVQFYGHVTATTDENGRYRARWTDTQIVMAMACDLLVPGFNNDHVINMRLWRAKASRELDLHSFNAGNYINAVESKVKSETISKVLYPSDDISEGQELRLKQQYFFVCATFQDILRRYRKENVTFDDFPDQVAVQLNDTHPAIAIPELMRILLDVEGLGWEQAWDLVRTHLRLHQPHPHARSPGDLAGGHARPGAAPAPGDHLRDQPALPRGGGQPLPGQQPKTPGDVAHRRGSGAAGAHGQPGHHRQPFGQRRRRSPLRTAQNLPVPQLPRNVSGPDQLQDQRHHPPALAALVQPTISPN